MPQTPYFPAWRSRLANLGRHLESFACQPLLHLEQIFAPLLPPGLLSQSDEGPNSRERLYSLSRTFWAFLYQAFNPGCPCREAVRQVLCHLGLHDARPEEADPNNSAYCTARKRLPLQVLQSARQATAVQAQRRLPAEQSNWLGHDTKVLDGSTLSTADTPQNQRHYPQLSNQKPGCGFPLMKVLGLFDLMSGALLGYAKGNKHKSELGLLRQLLDLIKPNDVLLADRGFCTMSCWRSCRFSPRLTPCCACTVPAKSISAGAKNSDLATLCSPGTNRSKNRVGCPNHYGRKCQPN